MAKVNEIITDTMRLNKFMRDVFKNATEKGWHDQERSALEIHALIHSEISEATEEVREGTPHYYVDKTGKPQGEAVELADAVIRIADYFGSKGWNFAVILREKMAYNRTRTYRHGNKKY
jgi:hypothetical protein